MAVNVQTEIDINRPRSEVASYASDPDNATSWYQNITSVEWKSPRPLTVGSRVAFVARFLGRRLAYTYEVKELLPGQRFVQATAEGPFPMETTYTWDDNPDGGTRMKLRNRGEPALLETRGSDHGQRDAPGQSEGPGPAQGHPGGTWRPGSSRLCSTNWMICCSSARPATLTRPSRSPSPPPLLS